MNYAALREVWSTALSRFRKAHQKSQSPAEKQNVYQRLLSRGDEGEAIRRLLSGANFGSYFSACVGLSVLRLMKTLPRDQSP